MIQPCARSRQPTTHFAGTRRRLVGEPLVEQRLGRGRASQAIHPPRRVRGRLIEGDDLAPASHLLRRQAQDLALTGDLGRALAGRKRNAGRHDDSARRASPAPPMGRDDVVGEPRKSGAEWLRVRQNGEKGGFGFPKIERAGCTARLADAGQLRLVRAFGLGAESRGFGGGRQNRRADFSQRAPRTCRCVGIVANASVKVDAGERLRIRQPTPYPYTAHCDYGDSRGQLRAAHPATRRRDKGLRASTDREARSPTASSPALAIGT